jgi:hypothetical protein
MSPSYIRLRQHEREALDRAEREHQTEGVSILRALSARANELMWVLKLLDLADDPLRAQRVAIAARALAARSPADLAALDDAVRQLAAALPAKDEPAPVATARAAVANLAILALARMT